MTPRWPVLAVLRLLPPLAIAADISGLVIGQASVIGGDTIEIYCKSIRQEGIDALESNQACEACGKRDMACGRDAATVCAGFADGPAVSTG